MTVSSETRPQTAYADAKSFYRTWHSDSDSDMMFGTMNALDVVIPGLMERHGIGEIEARYMAKIANESVLDEKYGR